ncbi:Hsp20/alpha crystallin family protein [Hahella ganghwensis]|uniref:Hsp20/alpha crystallin family protein n=1 Tax=Hahella ganghwensis TaxID=286420 RepID=UPI0003664521|nr:Hsp20/alpha crystallin family protein [Hahella ganghwensis]
MNLQKLNPWNWFKHEDSQETTDQVPVSREDADSIPAYSPGASSLLRLHREMDQLFDDVFSAFCVPTLQPRISDQRFAGRSPAMKDYRPRIDVAGDNDQYDITLDVPGMTANDLTIEVKGEILTIKGQKEENHEHKDKHYYRMERHYGSFQRTLSLPLDANADNIKATLKDGLLKLEIPRKPSDNDDIKRISISS